MDLGYRYQRHGIPHLNARPTQLLFQSWAMQTRKAWMNSTMIAREFRASKTFITFVISMSIFTDILLQNLIVPVLPYALRERVGLSAEDEVQKWNSILLGAYSASLMVGSCRSNSI